MARQELTAEEVDHKIAQQRENIGAMRYEDDHQVLALYDLGNLHSKRFRTKRSLSDLVSAIECGRRAISMMTEKYPKRARVLNNLGVWLEYRYNETSCVDDLEAAVEALQQALAIMSVDDHDRVILLSNLANRLRILYECRGNAKDLNSAIHSGEEAFRSASKIHPTWVILCNNLTTLLHLRYRRNSDYSDLEKSISLGEEVKASISSSHSSWSKTLKNLSTGLDLRYKRTGEIKHLDEAINYGREALLPPNVSGSERSAILNNLSTFYGSKYTELGQLEDLNHSIGLEQEALDLMPNQSPNRPGYLSNIGNRLFSRYMALGNLKDLEEAIHRCQDAVSITSSDSLHRISRLNNLGNLLFAQYNATQRLQDLEHAIHSGKTALMLIDNNHPERGPLLSNLTVQLGSKFSRSGKKEDLEEAIGYARGLIAVSSNHVERPGRIANLGNLLCKRYEIVGQIVDIEDAISCLEKAVVSSQPNNIHRAGWMSNLAYCLQNLFAKAGRPQDLEDGIKIASDSVDITPVTDVRIAERLISLGNLLLTRFETNLNVNDAQNALVQYTAAWNIVYAPTMVRIKAARGAASLLVTQNHWSEAAAMFTSAINLSTRIVHGAISREDREFVLENLTGVVPLAASAALKAGHSASEAAQIIETGRCILTALAMNARRDLIELKEALPLLHERYIKCRYEISKRPKLDLEDRYAANVASYQDLYTELAKIESQIRQHYGFEQFQLPPSPAEMMKLARSAPIVIFNVSEISSEAIIVTSSEIRGLLLPKFVYRDLLSRAESISTTGSPSRRNIIVIEDTVDEKMNQKIELEDTLQWLWDVAVYPVLDYLKDSHPQRMLWMSGGLVGLMPIHAAGNHSDGSADNTISRVISSYVSTFKALKYALEKPTHDTSNNQMALIMMPQTPRKAALNVKHEAEAIHSAFPGTVISLSQPQKTQVLDALPTCRFAHFACHASPNPKVPSDGGLWLAKDGGKEVLTISELDNLTLTHAEIAYLSACSTAELSPNTLLDEAIHLSNSFQMVGYRHVIGTMWGAEDHAAGEVARLFYGELQARMRGKAYGDMPVADIFHHAVWQFRKGQETQVLKWGAFMHSGP